jgi:hypothetical protein
VLGFVRPFDRHAEVIGLFFGELGEFHADFFEVQARPFWATIEQPGLRNHFTALSGQVNL